MQNQLREKRRKLETEIPWRKIGRNIAHGIGTKKDTSSWYKNILHRAMYLKGITTTTRTIRCTSCGRSHEDLNHFWKCPKYKPIWKKLINLMKHVHERNINSRGERENPRLYTRMGIPGNTKGRENTQQRTARINAHANMEIHHNSTHESIDRRNTAEKHKHRHNKEANNE